jgi:hypothetical protein
MTVKTAISLDQELSPRLSHLGGKGGHLPCLALTEDARGVVGRGDGCGRMIVLLRSLVSPPTSRQVACLRVGPPPVGTASGAHH